MRVCAAWPCLCVVGAVTVDAADTRQVLQVLSYACKMLQRVPLRQQALEAASRGSISFDSLWELLLLLALKSEHPAVRCVRVRISQAEASPSDGLSDTHCSLPGPFPDSLWLHCFEHSLRHLS